jgi:hypothetical protein
MLSRVDPALKAIEGLPDKVTASLMVQKSNPSSQHMFQSLASLS